MWDYFSGMSGYAISEGFEPHKPVNLTVTNYNGKPKLEWTHYSYPNGCFPIEYLTGYNIYRSLLNRHFGFTKIGSIVSDDCEEESYIDHDVFIGNWKTAYYRIKTENGTRESIFSDVVSIDIGGFLKQSFGDSKNSAENTLNNFSLEQNYPNPFNPTTIIRYTIPNISSEYNLSNVTLKIYDILGRELTTLINEEKQPGTYEFKFDASSINRRIEGGVYFYQLKAGSFIQTNKMILLE